MSSNLIIDAGNHTVKMFLFEGNETIWHHSIRSSEIDVLHQHVADKKYNHAVVSSVIELDNHLISELKKKSPLLLLDSKTATPLKIKYTTPETLGPDRLAASVAGWQLSAGGNVLVIVAGTCITYNVVDNSGAFLGGAISPGFHMRLQAMHVFTGKLPLATADGEHPLTGDSTLNSLRSGAINGGIEEVKGMIDEYRKQFPDLKIVVSGGDGDILAKGLKNGIFARPNLVAEGLNTILNYNVVNRLIR